MARQSARGHGYLGIESVYDTGVIPMPDLLCESGLVWLDATLYWSYHPERGFPAFTTERAALDEIRRAATAAREGSDGDALRTAPEWTVVDTARVRRRNEGLVANVPKRFFHDYVGNNQRMVSLDPVPEHAQVGYGVEYVLVGSRTPNGVLAYLLTWADLEAELADDDSSFDDFFPTEEQRIAFVSESSYDSRDDPPVKWRVILRLLSEFEMDD
jgi:hypothetical protein